MDKLLTISIAAYNIEKYIANCLNSLINTKELDLLDILIVDDGSSDNTKTLAETYAKTYPSSIRYIAKENGGHGSTINKGIELARGKYFRALDGDDWLSSDLDELLNKLKKIDSDAVVCDYYNCYENNETHKVSYGLKEKEYTFADLTSQISWLPYHCLIYKTALLKDYNIKLDEHCFYVDTELMLLPIPYVKTISYLPLAIYCYRLGREGQSVSIASRIKNLNDSRIVAYRLLNYYKQIKPLLDKAKNIYFNRGLANHCVWHYRSLLSAKPSFSRLKEIINFDHDIYQIAPLAYTYMVDKKRSKHDIRMVKILRNSSYLLYFPFVIYRRAKNNIHV